MTPWKLTAAYLLDLIAGDPRWFPHPVRAMGYAIFSGERLLRHCAKGPKGELLAGGVLTVAVVWISAGAAVFLISRSRQGVEVLGDTSEVLLAWTALATGSLLQEAGAVVDALDRDDLAEARLLAGRIVGRDTDRLDAAELARAVIETAAENLCDGIVAPIIYLTAGGVSWALAYKAINTLDSVIGHPEPPYTWFGRVAARLDDAANLIPARVTAALIAVAAVLTKADAAAALRSWWRDGGKHSSPNAGQCEAAMAGALQVRLGGTSFYAGTPSRKPVLESSGHQPTREDARAALKIVRVASGLAFACALLLLCGRAKR